MSRLYRRLFLTRLQAAFDAGQLRFSGELGCARNLGLPAAVARHSWVVYAKRPFGGPQQVLDYLGRYTHRVAIANSRLVGLAEGRVSFRWKNYRHHNKQTVITLGADEFIRHVLPDGFDRIRHYGYLANGQRAAQLADCRRLLAVPDPAPPAPAAFGRHGDLARRQAGASSCNTSARKVAIPSAQRLEDAGGG